MWKLLLLVLPWIRMGVTALPRNAQDITHTLNAKDDVSSPPPRPQIHYCRSPNMETFTCWWRFPDNPLLGNGNVTYVLTYAVGKGSKQECPDYTTGGPNSCYFDSQHTQVWEVYCMNVTAISARGNQTSEEHCLDVAEIVETDPPLNLTYQLMSNSEESGSTVVVSWQYPLTVDVQMGWVTLIYELQFRRKSEPHNWKVKGGLREPHLELLDLPVGSYVVRVRCKSRNAGLWSKWSSPLTVDIPAKQGIDKTLAVILVTGVSMMTFLIIGFGVIPQSKRLKALLLPPVPKPRIRGIDSTLLKSGKVEEINRLFSSFHGYTTPQYSEEVLLQVSMDEGLSFKENSMAQSKKMEGEPPPSINGPGCPRGQQPMQTLVGPTCYSQALAPYWQASTHGQEDSSALSPTAMPTLAQPDPSILHSELLTFPALGYSMILSPAPVQQINQDFYTCVNGINARGAVHLVPCLPDHSKQSPYSQIGGAADSAKKGLTERSIQLTSTSGQGEPVANVVTAGPGSVAVGTAFDSYATLDDLRLHNEQCVGMASSQ
ncbi:prolactin receptor-like [Scleropages formosus]|uniref:Prolactin receptor-like n=1 Tax=Scleropages formosus TaxID=113540 RepID=A0A8C9TW96_SCLFO|nr:prolactin receptor-like [Scleropages formosus]XP_018613328.1 prolactin receptor-like [Scleropages formosus]XP_018613338.1 prolactin receptor-like [Scleropages formosus]